MWDKIKNIDWEKYIWPGKDVPQVLPLLEGLLNDDATVRGNSAWDLSNILRITFEKAINFLPYDIISPLVGMLPILSADGKTLVIGLLIDLVSFSNVRNIDELDERTRALKSAVCEHVSVFEDLLKNTDHDPLKDDLKLLLSYCNS